MSTMTTTDLWSRDRDEPLTVEDLDRTPEDGRRYELLDGMLIVSPAPFNVHQDLVTTLLLTLHRAAPPGYRFLTANGLVLGRSTQLIPDLTVIRAEDFDPKYQTVPPELVVEVASASTALFDRNVKMDRYARFGVPSFWIVVPGEPSITAYGLTDAGYREVGRAVGDAVLTAQDPFEVEIIPAELVAGA